MKMALGQPWNLKNWQKVVTFCDQLWNLKSFAHEHHHICTFLANIMKFSTSFESQDFSANCHAWKMWAERWPWKIEKPSWKIHENNVCKLCENPAFSTRCEENLWHWELNLPYHQYNRSAFLFTEKEVSVKRQTQSLLGVRIKSIHCYLKKQRRFYRYTWPRIYASSSLWGVLLKSISLVTLCRSVDFFFYEL